MPRQIAEWPAAFATAAELARRGYSAAFFLGNQPTYDVLVLGNSSRRQFAVQVKGFKTKPTKSGARGAAILVGNLDQGDPDDWFVIVYAQMRKSLHQSSLDPFEFFVATRRELRGIRNRGEAFPQFTSDWLFYPDLLPYQDGWNRLPPA